MAAASSILSVLALIAATAVNAAPKAVPVDIFPERLVFEATVVRAAPSAWKEGPKFTRTRTIEVELRIDRVLKAAGRPPAESRAQTVTVTETSRTMGRFESGNGWGDADLNPGDAFLVFGEGEDPAAVFPQPTSVYRKQTDPAFVQDVEWIIEGEKLDVAAQASRLLALLGKSPKDHTLFVGRYLAAVAHGASGPSRAALLDAIAHVESIKLDESARAELLRALHVGLVMQEAPPADEIQAFLAASLRTLASAGVPEGGDVPARLESVVQVYLPWLAKHVPGFPSAALPLVAKDERGRVGKTALSLAALERFPPQSRDVLRQLAGALQR